MNADEIRGVTFDRTMRGYRPEEVDEFLARVAAEMDKLQEEKEDAEQKMFILAEKVDQYRDDEETLKTALLNAQRMGESVIHEARQKAETIIYDANSKASQLKNEADASVAASQAELERLKKEVAQFKSTVLELYRQHIACAWGRNAETGAKARGKAACRRAARRAAGREEAAGQAQGEKGKTGRCAARRAGANVRL